MMPNRDVGSGGATWAESGGTSVPRRLIVAGGDAQAVVLRIRGRLDDVLGAELVDAVEAGLEAAPNVRLDLRGVVEYTDEGISALAACTSRGARFYRGAPASR